MRRRFAFAVPRRLALLVLAATAGCGLIFPIPDLHLIDDDAGADADAATGADGESDTSSGSDGPADAVGPDGGPEDGSADGTDGNATPDGDAAPDGGGDGGGDGDATSTETDASAQSRVPIGPASAVATGSAHSCAIVDGGVFCWGANISGELGTGLTDNRPHPVPHAVPNVSGATALSCGSGTGCVVLAGGDVACWGQLFTTDNGVVQPVAGIHGATAVAVGERHGCAVASGDVYCWGSNGKAQLGQPVSDAAPEDFRMTPVKVALGSEATAVAAGSDHSCALLVNGSLACWGADDFAQLGDGLAQSVPQPVPQVLTGTFKGVAAGYGFTCVFDTSGASCLGRRHLAGEDGTLQHVSGFSGTSFLTASRSDHACAIASAEDDAGHAYCWGGNDDGQLGDGTMTASATWSAVAVHAGSLVFTAIAAGGGVAATVALPDGGGATGNESGHTCGLTTTGAVHCWGINDFGQLGDGTTARRLTP
jgi:alpha-tubulin suppressor-like RCC1 family protein